MQMKLNLYDNIVKVLI